MSDSQTVDASPELLYVFFRSIADLPSHLLPLAVGYGLSPGQLARIRSLSVQDFRRLRQLCPIYFRAVGASVKVKPSLLDEALRVLEAAIAKPLVGNGEPTADFLALRAFFLYLNSQPDNRVDALESLGVSREQVSRIRQLPVSQLAELHKLQTRLCTAVHIKITLVDELLERLLKGLSMDRYQQALQEALLARAAPRELMNTLFGWSDEEYAQRQRGYPPSARSPAVNPTEQLRIWVAWEETRDLTVEAERYLTTAHSTRLGLDRIWTVVGKLDQSAGRVLLGLLGQWDSDRGPEGGKLLPGVQPDLPEPYAAAAASLCRRTNLPDFIDQLLRVVRELTGSPAASCLLCDEPPGQPARMVLLAAEGVSRNVMQAAQSFPLHGSFTGEVVKRRRLEQGVITRSPEVNEALVEALTADGKAHVTSLPLLHGRRVLGVLNLNSPHRLDIDPEKASLLLQFGQRIASRLNELQAARNLAAPLR